MRRSLAEGNAGTVPFTQNALDKMKDDGFKYVQVKGFTSDKHYDYSEPQFLVLFPMKDLPTDPALKDIYEPVESDLLTQWANETTEGLEIIVANKRIK